LPEDEGSVEGQGMTGSAIQPKIVRGERRIIERPRLIKLLDEADARTILLLAPAGYGKTTLARQWAKTLNGAIWVTLTPAHRDLSVLALDFARGADGIAGSASRFIGEYVRARPNPQRSARELAMSVGEHIRGGRIQWLVIDDYHELIGTPEAELFLEVLHTEVPARFLVASRVRPDWATQRLTIYGEVQEVSRELLAMDGEETKRLIGHRRELNSLSEQAEGWPAVLALAARAGVDPLTSGATLPAALYEYLLDELYHSAPSQLQDQLGRLALAPDLSDATLEELFGEQHRVVVDEARDLGFLSAADQGAELHPLVRSFLLEKLAAEKRVSELVRPAVAACVDRQRWDRAFDLILRFRLMDLVEPVLEAAYAPLLRFGQLGTLSAFAERVRLSPTFPPAVVDLVDAEVALRDGAVQLAAQIAGRVRERLTEGHPFRSKASAIIGRGTFIQGRLGEAEGAYRDAFETAASEEDLVEALRGWALASVQGETQNSAWVVERLAEHRNRSPLDLLRYRTVELAQRHFGAGMPEELMLDEELHVLRQVEDPRARSSFASLAAYVAAVRAEYRRAGEYMALADAEIELYDLDFARPHACWNNAFISLGLRQFAKADRMLQHLEDQAQEKPLGHHILNARLLRARLSLQTGQPEQALEAVASPDRETAIPAIRGEYLATRAVALAVLKRDRAAETTAQTAQETSNAVEVRVLAEVARAIVGARAGDAAAVAGLWECASALGAWDPVVTGARSSIDLASALATVETIRPSLAALYDRSNDLGLLRRAGFRVRSKRRPEELLSPREREVLDLLARGYRNRDIADALVISQSTTKVHVRHILEKLGVRTRSEAVARINALEQNA
jgi:ATP/maltotriose-dependent transcriptional regulator MalT